MDKGQLTGFTFNQLLNVVIILKQEIRKFKKRIYEN